MDPSSSEQKAAPGTSAPGGPALQRLPRELMISYAQNFEDVLLHRVFGDLDRGFYVDIGAFDPVLGSVTKLLYDRGWSGINIEPGSVFRRLAAERPRDINLNIAILDEEGTVDFVEAASDPGASHVEAGAEAAQGETESRTYRVSCDRLDRVLERHAAGQLINLMKIDAEGSEGRIVHSTDWAKIRPQILLIEAVAPWTNALVSHDWEPKIVASGYTRAYFDGINLFFVRNEDADLLRHFDRPVNVLDWFGKHDPVKERAVADAEEFRRINWLASIELDTIPRAQRGLPKLSDADTSPAPTPVPEPEEVLRQLGAALSYLKEVTSFLSQLASLLDRVPRRRRGLPELGRTATSETASELSAPRAEQRLPELAMALEWTIRFDRLMTELDDTLKRWRPSDAAARVEPNIEPTDDLELARQLHAAAQAKLRLDYILAELKDPDGPRALRLVLPLARLIRRTTSRSSRKRAIEPAHQFAKPVARKGGSAFRRLAGLLFRPVRIVLHPLAMEIRDFMTEPLRVMPGRLDATARHIEARIDEMAFEARLDAVTRELGTIRHLLANNQAKNEVSPELIKSIELLLLTMSVSESRK